jgi:hypothetical protein
LKALFVLKLLSFVFAFFCAVLTNLATPEQSSASGEQNRGDQRIANTRLAPANVSQMDFMEQINYTEDNQAPARHFVDLHDWISFEIVRQLSQA